jgi:hypothetical protein
LIWWSAFPQRNGGACYALMKRSDKLNKAMISPKDSESAA